MSKLIDIRKIKSESENEVSYAIIYDEPGMYSGFENIHDPVATITFNVKHGDLVTNDDMLSVLGHFCKHVELLRERKRDYEKMLEPELVLRGTEAPDGVE